MIGRVTWPANPDRPDVRPLVATLGLDGEFTTEGGTAAYADAAALWLADELADSPRGPAEGRPGVRFLERVATVVGGTLELGDEPDSPEGTVY